MVTKKRKCKILVQRVLQLTYKSYEPAKTCVDLSVSRHLMRIACFILVVICFLSCNEKENKPIAAHDKTWTEQQKRAYFNDSFARRYEFGLSEMTDSAQSFAAFFKKYYPNI